MEILQNSNIATFFRLGNDEMQADFYISTAALTSEQELKGVISSMTTATLIHPKPRK